MQTFVKQKIAPRPKDIILASLSWVLLILAIAALFISIAIGKIDRYHFYNSDALSIPAMHRDLASGYSLRGWFFGPAPSFFPDIPLYVILRFLTGNLHWAIMIYGLAQLLLFILSFILLSRQVFGPGNMPHAPILAAGTALCLALSTGECTALLPILLNSFHFGASLMLVVSLAFVISLLRDAKKNFSKALIFSGLLWIVSTLTLASDAIYLVQCLLPALGVLFVLFVFSLISVRSVLAIYVPLTLSVLVVPKIHQWLLIYRNARNGSSTSRFTLETLLTNSSRTFSEIAGWTKDHWFSSTIFIIILVLWIAFMLGSLVYVILRFKTVLSHRRRYASTVAFIGSAVFLTGSIGTIILSSVGSLPPWSIWICFVPAVLLLGWLALKEPSHMKQRPSDTGILATCMVFVFSVITTIASALFIGVGLPRYFLPAILIPVFFGWPFLIAGWRGDGAIFGKPPIKYGLFGLIIVLFFASGAVRNLRNVASLPEVLDYYPEFVQCLDRETQRRNLHNGLTQYWDAKYLTMLSKNDLHLVQVRHSIRRGIVVEHFVNNLNWYNNDFDFVIAEDASHGMRAIRSAKIVHQFGEPADTFVCRDRTKTKRTVLVYNTPEDRIFQEQYRNHFFRNFHAGDLPSQIGDVIESSRIVREGSQGFLTYGPYIELFLGDYAFEIQYEAQSSGENVVGKWDVLFHPAATDQSKTLAKGTLTKNEDQVATGIFRIREVGKVEIRTYYKGHGTLKVDSLFIKRLR